jgi:glycosyltransferase involved in cell wall biosynthesis
MTVHDLIPLLHDDGADSRYRRRFARHLRAGVRMAQRIICVSENTRRDLVTKYPDAAAKAVVIPWGIDPPADVVCELPADVATPPFVVGLGGGGAKRKNVPTMIRALAALPGHLAGVPLVILGVTNATEREALSNLARELAVDHRVRLEAFVTEAMLDAYLKNAACVLYLSTYEGFGLPPLEAMASGTPVVTSNVSSLPEVTGGAAVLIDPYDPAAIADGMRRVLTDPALRADLVARGLARVREYSWERSVRRVREVYAEVAAGQ